VSEVPALSIVLTGRAYGRRATLEVTGDTLTWRAQRGHVQTVRENIATTTRDVRDVTWLERRLSRGGSAIALLSLLWMGTESVLFGVCTLALAAAWIAYRARRPQRWLGLDLGERWLVMRIDAPSSPDAKRLADRVRHCLLTGEVGTAPLALP